MSWLITAQTVPAPSLDLLFTSRSLVDNISGQNLITFSRASTATYIDSTGTLKTAAINEPRFDHNPTTGESLGLLIEEQRTNFGTYSEQINNAAWVFEFGTKTVTANAIAAPDGTVTANMVTGAGFTQITQPGSGLGGPKTFSIFLKAGTLSVVALRLFSPTVPFERLVEFNLSTGTATVTYGSPVTVGSIQAFPDGWYRCAITVTDSAGASNSTIRFGTGTFFIWGAQVEAGAFPTSYIPTTTAQVTRFADSASITGTNFSGWHNSTEGTVFTDFRLEADRGQTRWAVQIGSAALTGPNSNVIGKVETNLAYAETRDGFVTQYSASGTFPSSRRAKIAYAVKNLSHQAAFDGVLSAAGTGTLGAPSNTVLLLGRNVASTEMLCGTIARLTYWPTRLPDATLQKLTQ